MNKIYPSVKSLTLSVLMSENSSIICGLYINNEYCNVSLNFERDQARILGYPMDWGVHDVNIDFFNSDSMTYQELAEVDKESIANIPAYISKETEVEIFCQLKKSLKKQFDFENVLTETQKESALDKIDSAIKFLA